MRLFNFTKKMNVKTFFSSLAFLGLSIGAINAQTWNIGTPTATDVKATLDANGTMTISGTGAMQDFDPTSAPWYSVKDNITTLVINSGVTTIGNCAFWDCNTITGNLTIPNLVTSIGIYAFSMSGITSATIPGSVTSIISNAFWVCSKLTAINVDENNPNYCSENGVLFDKDKTTLIQFPSGKSGTYVIPNSVTSIENFSYCYLITSVTIPASVTSIEVGAFQSNYGLQSITCLNPDPSKITLGSKVFLNVPVTTCVLRVPVGSYSAYHTAPQWSDFTNIVEGTSAVENAELQTLKIYPNPFKDELIIENGEFKINKVEICDLSWKIINSEWSSGKTVNVSNLPQGIYFVRIETNKGTVTRKIVKQ